MLAFKPVADCRVGTFSRLLVQSYAALLSEPQWEAEQDKFVQFDREVFENPETVGRCVFATLLENRVIGFASLDPRKGSIGLVGHNCILPEFRGNGYGKQQLLELLRQMRTRGICKARASTSEHPFFLSARGMYVACGFLEKRRYAGGPDPRYRLIEYEREL
jgi:GNAT superfamily N-acetyltransferase